jgi:chromosome segregation ATPase
MTLDEARSSILNALARKEQERAVLVRLVEAIELAVTNGTLSSALQTEVTQLQAAITEKQEKLDHLDREIAIQLETARIKQEDEQQAHQARLLEETQLSEQQCEVARKKRDQLQRSTDMAQATLTQLQQNIVTANHELAALSDNLQVMREQRNKALSILSTL